MNILIAEDDSRLNEGIRLALAEEKYIFFASYTYKGTCEILRTQQIDLLILDINFPDGSGIDVLKMIQNIQIDTKVILLTANNMESDVVLGLELGAQDYITKPFSLMVLRARIKVQIRTMKQLQQQSTFKEKNRKEEEIFQGEDYRFDFSNMIFTVLNQKIELSKTEQKLLKILINNQGITITRTRLMESVWSQEAEFVEEHALTVTMKRLRDKLGQTKSGENRIKTIYGLGYTWVR